MLTIEWVEGARLVDKALLTQYQADPSKLVDTLVQCSLKQMLEVRHTISQAAASPLPKGSTLCQAAAAAEGKGAWGLAWQGVRALSCPLLQFALTPLAPPFFLAVQNGFFHADPHAGNLLATPDGKLCYLDFGMMSYVESNQRYGIIEAVIHLVSHLFLTQGWHGAGGHMCPSWQSRPRSL